MLYLEKYIFAELSLLWVAYTPTKSERNQKILTEEKYFGMRKFDFDIEN